MLSEARLDVLIDVIVERWGKALGGSEMDDKVKVWRVLCLRRRDAAGVIRDQGAEMRHGLDADI